MRSDLERLSMRTKNSVRRVAETVVEVLREPVSDQVPRKLAGFQLDEWKSSYHWLDANGLALYFRNALRAKRLDFCIPREVMARLDSNHIDNQSRLEHHLAEFFVINDSFRAAGIRYVNLKGFTLEPDYCPDLSLRYQCDLDFMAHRSDRKLCRTVLESLGYRLTSDEADTLEFKPPEDHLPDIADLYKPRKQQAVEVHFGSQARNLDLGEECMNRLVWVNRMGAHYPALGEPDRFFSVVFHLYRHLLSEWVRLSWFYELGWCLRRRAHDASFWTAVLERAEADHDIARALSVVMAFSKQGFSGSVPEHLGAVCSKSLTKSVQLWIAHYGPEMLFGDFPGNKLYLLLLRELGTSDWQEISRKRLLPFHAPTPALYGESWAERIGHVPENTRYGLSRATFHAREGFRYLKEQWRWRRRIERAAVLGPGSK